MAAANSGRSTSLSVTIVCCTIYIAELSIVFGTGTPFFFLFYQGFIHRHWRFNGQQGKGGDHLLFDSTTSTGSRTLRHLFTTLHLRWLSSIFNRNAFIYQTLTRRDLPPYRITIWVNDWWCNICLFTWWIDTRFLLQRFEIGNRRIWTRIDYQFIE